MGLNPAPFVGHCVLTTWYYCQGVPASAFWNVAFTSVVAAPGGVVGMGLRRAAWTGTRLAGSGSSTVDFGRFAKPCTWLQFLPPGEQGGSRPPRTSTCSNDDQIHSGKSFSFCTTWNPTRPTVCAEHCVVFGS